MAAAFAPKILLIVVPSSGTFAQLVDHDLPNWLAIRHLQHRV